MRSEIEVSKRNGLVNGYMNGFITRPHCKACRFRGPDTRKRWILGGFSSIFINFRGFSWIFEPFRVEKGPGGALPEPHGRHGGLGVRGAALRQGGWVAPQAL